MQQIAIKSTLDNQSARSYGQAIGLYRPQRQYCVQAIQSRQISLEFPLSNYAAMRKSAAGLTAPVVVARKSGLNN